MNKLREVSVRELQHNLAEYLELAKTIPLSITKYGNKEVILVNPEEYSIKKRKVANNKYTDLAKMEFIGMHKDKKSWKNTSSAKLAEMLRNKAWQGQIE